MTDKAREALAERITAYLSAGGLFNPEMANHDAVRDLLIDCRAALADTQPSDERTLRPNHQISSSNSSITSFDTGDRGGQLREGWKWVPIEPTEEMTYAARYALRGDRSGNIAAPVYRAMIAAAPTIGTQGSSHTDPLKSDGETQ